MACTFQVTFQVQPVVAKSFAYFVLGDCEYALKLIWPLHQANTSSPTTSRGFQHQGKADGARSIQPFGERAQNRCSRQHGQPHLCHRRTRIHFITHDSHHWCRRANKSDMRVCTDLGKAGILRKKAIARMNGISTRNKRSTDNIGNVQITFTTRPWPNTNTLICHTHRQRITISF